MIPLTDLTPEAIRALPDDELRVRVACLFPQYRVATPTVSWRKIGAEMVLLDRCQDSDFSEAAVPMQMVRGVWVECRNCSVPNYPASYDAILPVVRAWCGGDWGQLVCAKVARVGRLLPIPTDHSKDASEAFDDGLAALLDASPRDLCVAVLCAAREVGA